MDLPLIAGIVAVVFALLLAIGVQLLSRAPLFQLACGADGKLSTSKAQWLIWTGLGVAAFVSMTIVHGFHVQDLTVPWSLMALMGISTGTMVVAKGVATLKKPKPHQAKNNDDPKYLVCDDHGFPDLSKSQLLAWTVIGGGIFFVNLCQNLVSTKEIPDVSQPLLYLMGIGHIGYLGKKYVDPNHAKKAHTAKVIEPNELPNALTTGWTFQTQLADGRVVVDPPLQQ